MKNIWIVVIVESGIPTEIEIFCQGEEAKNYKLTKEKELNMEDDSIEIFEKRVNL